MTEIAREGDLALNDSAHWVQQRPPALCSVVVEQPMANPDAHLVAPTATVPPGMDRAAVEALITKHYTGLRLLIQRRVGDADVAADILNQAACTAWEKWQTGQVRRPEEIGGYIFQVAMNLLRNRRRNVAERADRRVEPDVLEQLPADATDRWLESKIAARPRDPRPLLSARGREGGHLSGPGARARPIRQGFASRASAAQGTARGLRSAAIRLLHALPVNRIRGKQHANGHSPSG